MSDRARVLIFDIEATSLNASFGHMLCFGYKYLGDKRPKVISLADFRTPPAGAEPDLYLTRRVHEIITNEADILVTYYGKEYDRKFINTRALMADLPPLPPLSAEHVDLYFTTRGNLKLHSNRLQALSEALGCPWSKTPVRADTWRRAMRGDPKAMKYVIDHCRLDVDILEWCYLKLRPCVRQHPPLSAAAGACRSCGADRWVSNGRRFRLGEQQHRMQCQGCGAWKYVKVTLTKAGRRERPVAA